MDTNNNTTTPKFIRLPKSGQICPHSGLRRSFLNFITLPNKSNNYNPQVESRVIKKPGTRRGIKLINYFSLMEFLESQPDGKTAAEQNEKGRKDVL